MQQLTQLLKNGDMQLLEVPFPALQEGCILVRNHFSAVSAGTEGKTVKDARLSYIGKARARKEELQKVIQSVKTIGLKETYRMVMNKLDAPSSLGYSCAGEVIAVADDIKDIHPGDLVACGGATAVHAEVVSVPRHLCVKLEADIDLSEASFITIGAIALQGVRQSELVLGENAVVIGLGLVGQITMQLLKAGGINALGIDIDDQAVQFAKQAGEKCFNRNTEQLEEIIAQQFDGNGADAVLITAATSSHDPIELAGILARKKGKVIIVGAVPTGFSRKNYYIKELDLRMSSSYGPGRYDATYEEQGLDYPYAYVRWTENRNMEAIARLIAEKKINIQSLVTNTFHFQESLKAYDLILNRSSYFCGIVLKYDIKKTLHKEVRINKNQAESDVTAGMIGAGSFGQNFMLPALKGLVQFKGVATARPNNARNIADKYGFEYCTGEANQILSDTTINTVFILTRHDTHADFVIESLKKGKNTFTEKPLCLTKDELIKIAAVYNESNARLMVGFNRRFAPLTAKLQKHISTDIPSAINYRINAGKVSADHWVHDLKIGGGRIIGELCHFIDYCAFISGSMIKSVQATAMSDAYGNNDTVAVSLQMMNGSVASISYFSNGNKLINKEYIEVFNGGTVGIIDDFKSLTVFGKDKMKYTGLQDKGHKEGAKAFVESIKSGTDCPVPFQSIYNTTAATFNVINSIAAGGLPVDNLF